jgi:hypothetical protein
MRRPTLVTKKKEVPKEALDAILSDLIRELVEADLQIQEGKVMTSGDAPYRRLDCDQRALVYLRTRPKKRAVRIDITGLWQTPRSTKLRIPTAGGAATLLIRTPAEARLAAKFIIDTVEKTRASRLRPDRVASANHARPVRRDFDQLEPEILREGIEQRDAVAEDDRLEE